MKKKWIVVAFAACAIALTSCNVFSEPESIAVESVTLDTTTLTLAPSATRKLTATVKPDNADDKTVVWSSSDTAVVMVDNDGTVGAIKTGTATITAKAGDKQATCTVTVKSDLVAVENITLDATTLTLAPGATRKLTATVKPDNADDKTVVWSSSDTAVAMVGNDGTIGAIKTGTATITAKSGDKQATCTVTVSEIAVVNPDSPVAVESVMLNTTTLTIEPGKMRTLTATVTPSNAEDKIVTWSSSDEKVATVSDDGTVTAHAEGTVTITAKAGGKEATCTVAVKPILIAVKSVSLNMTILTLTSGETGKLTATVTPSDADDSTVAWSSSNADVATVGNDGTVTAIKAGKATITAQAGDITAECAVSVNPILVENVTLDVTTLTLAPGMTKKLAATVKPDNADDKTVTWSSSNVEVAMVSNDGTIGAIKAGKTSITAQAGDITAECVVTVHTDHSYSGGKCTSCGARPYMENGTIDEDGVLTYYYGGETNVVIPDGVTGIRYDAFINCFKLENVIIPDSVTMIGSKAFAGCRNLTSVTIPASVSAIGEKAFYLCTSLVNVVISEGVTIIRDGAFMECTSLTSVTIPGSVKSIGASRFVSNDVFKNCSNLTNVTIHEGVEIIGSCAFNNCKELTSVTIPDSVTSIEWSAFAGCSGLTSVTIPGSVKSIKSGAFDGCNNLIRVKYGGTLMQWCAVDNDDSITSVANITLDDVENLNTLEKLVIPDSVTAIGNYAFDGCKKLTSVTIPSSVTAIGNYAFNGCKKLTSVTIPSSVTNIGFYVFSGNFSVTYGGTELEWKKIERCKSGSIEGSYADGLSGMTITGSAGSTWIAE